MKFYIIPKAQTVSIPTKKNNDEIYFSLKGKLKKKKNIKIVTTSNSFIIERMLANNSHSTIMAKGFIHDLKENTIRLEVSAKDNFLIYKTLSGTQSI